jgi:hypothetical protein
VHNGGFQKRYGDREMKSAAAEFDPTRAGWVPVPSPGTRSLVWVMGPTVNHVCESESDEADIRASVSVAAMRGSNNRDE